MFDNIKALPADPILGLGQAFMSDPNPDKINLSVGVYQNESGHTPIFKAVKQAEQLLLGQQKSKSYVAQAGDPTFLQLMSKLLLGEQLFDEYQERTASVMTTGGSGALRMCAELLVSASDKPFTVWVGDPTWANHFPLLQSAGLSLEKFPYYNLEANQIDFDLMIGALKSIPHGDVVLLHGCCHNPTGADLNTQQWDQVFDVLLEREITPFIDIAYLGFGQGLDEDAYALRQAVNRCPEVLIAASCSKNFGVYRERAGIAIAITPSPERSQAAKTHLMSNARRAYSMPPYHGSAVVGQVLSSTELTEQWQIELSQVRHRMDDMRSALAKGLNNAQNVQNFDFVANSRGMFCYLGIPKEHVQTLREEYGIYMLASTRINLAGLSPDNLGTVVSRVSQLLIQKED